MSGDLRVASYIQPIWSLPHGRIVGWEALLRIWQGDQPLPPPVYLAADNNESIALERERSARLLHLGEWSRWRPPLVWLFLNISPTAARHALDHPSDLALTTARLAIPSHQIVVELLESTVPDPSAMAAIVQHYRELGCLVALDDFGVGHSNLDRLFHLLPDFVKLDRSLLIAAVSNPILRRAFRHLVGFVHAAGAIALAEGVETSEQAAIAIDAGVDLIQGYRYGRPAPWSTWLYSPAGGDAQQTLLADRNRPICPPIPPSLYQWFHLLSHRWLSEPQLGPWACVGAPEEVLRLYELDHRGVQIGPTHYCRWLEHNDAQRYAPLAAAAGSSWSHRPYFRDAIARPTHLIISEPYLALPDRRWEVTLAFASADAKRVLCADLIWRDLCAFNPEPNSAALHHSEATPAAFE
ncbi:MAG: EAL domain-containing protein [Hydrogenophilus sp.]|nr:EAL domain-containing protein [Hydrogenophilus sp.]